MICSSEKRFFTSNLLGVGNWTPNGGATQTWGDVAWTTPPSAPSTSAATRPCATLWTWPTSPASAWVTCGRWTSGSWARESWWCGRPKPGPS
ncbi:hypothetical protein BRN91_22180 [Xanthomonas oryzae pv. oryzae]|nr:hypothetical protein BRN91_22180 [Xanthomonas oryzae pv. oryzae]